MYAAAPTARGAMARRTAAGERTRRRARGAALLFVLLAVTLMSLALLVPLRNERLALQREREAELLFIGGQFRQALASYAAASPAGAARAPKALEDLLEDKRFPNPRRHLRRVYADPFTGAADWALIRQQGAIVGVASTSSRPPLKRSGFAAAEAAFAQADAYSGWAFVVQPVAPRAAASNGAAPPPAPGSTTAPAPDPTAPSPNPELDAKRECTRAWMAALNLCAQDQATSVSCRAAAGDVYRLCLGR